MEFFHSLKGVKVALDYADLQGVENIKLALANSEQIEINNLLLLCSPSGHKLKQSNMSTAKVVFIYDKSWVLAPMSFDLNLNLNPYTSIEPDALVIVNSAKTANSHLLHNISVVRKQIQKLKPVLIKLETDLNALGNWQQSLNALETLKLNLFSQSSASEQFNEIKQLVVASGEQLRLIEHEFDEITKDEMPAAGSGLQNARSLLIDTLKYTGLKQHKITTLIKKPISQILDNLKRAEYLKPMVAAVIDLPYLVGVFKIERQRRSKWNLEILGPVNDSEAKRRRQWEEHYCSAEVCELIEQLDSEHGTNLLELVGTEVKHKIEEVDDDVEVYIQQLEDLGLIDVVTDLRKEMNAMKRVSQRSMCMSSLSMNGSLMSGNDNAVIAAYEARIRKFEMLLMQAKLPTNTNHEMDIVRAETRAEAKAEAKAEFRAEQQQKKINELELQNEKLKQQLAQNSHALENILNSMGLQTFREDGYSIERVKGLGHKTTQQSFTQGDENVDDVLRDTLLNETVLFNAVQTRFGSIETLARKLQTENKQLSSKIAQLNASMGKRVALHSFKAGDLILFLPNNGYKPRVVWSAFNVNHPNCFLNPKHIRNLQKHDYLLARASEVKNYVVGDQNDNLFNLPNGAPWTLITADGDWLV